LGEISYNEKIDVSAIGGVLLVAFFEIPFFIYAEKLIIGHIVGAERGRGLEYLTQSKV
jgi:hypothetical protein